MRRAGRLAAEALDILVGHVGPGVQTEALDKLVSEFAMDHGALPAPSSTAAIPKRSARRSTTSSATASRTTSRCAEGDIVNIDVTLILDGWHGDSSRMFCVGDVPRQGAAPDATSPTKR